MSHNLSITNGKVEAFFGSGQKGWHGLGTVIPGRANFEQVLELAHLDWTVEKHPVFMAD